MSKYEGVAKAIAELTPELNAVSRDAEEAERRRHSVQTRMDALHEKMRGCVSNDARERAFVCGGLVVLVRWHAPYTGAVSNVTVKVLEAEDLR